MLDADTCCTAVTRQTDLVAIWSRTTAAAPRRPGRQRLYTRADDSPTGHTRDDHGRQQQRLRLPGLDRVEHRGRQRHRKLLRRGVGVRHRRHGVRGQSADRETAQVVPGPEDHFPVDQTEAGQGHKPSVPGAVGKSGKQVHVVTG